MILKKVASNSFECSGICVFYYVLEIVNVLSIRIEIQITETMFQVLKCAGVRIRDQLARPENIA